MKSQSATKEIEITIDDLLRASASLARNQLQAAARVRFRSGFRSLSRITAVKNVMSSANCCTR